MNGASTLFFPALSGKAHIDVDWFGTGKHQPSSSLPQKLVQSVIALGRSVPQSRDAGNKSQQALTNVTPDTKSWPWVKGKLSIQFGGKARMEWNNVRELRQAQASDSFLPVAPSSSTGLD